MAQCVFIYFFYSIYTWLLYDYGRRISEIAHIIPIMWYALDS